MPSNIQIILVVGAVLSFLIILYLFFRPIFTRKLIQNSIDDANPMLFGDEIAQGTLGLDKDSEEAAQEQELIILNLVSMDNSNFDMNQVLTLLKNLDAKYTSGFFNYKDASGNELFRIASGIKPGLLEPDTKTYILLLVLDLYKVDDPLKAFETMLEYASSISEKLHASICNSARAPLTKQMIEHLKSRTQEISHLQSFTNISSK